MVHGQANDLLRNAVRYRQVLPRGRLQATVRREVADKGIEVPSAVDVPRLKFVVQLVPGHAVLLRVHEDGEVGVVVPHAGHVLEVRYAWDVPQALTVSGGHSVSCLDRGVDVSEVDQSHCRAHLVHLAVDARGHDRGFSGEPEVLQVVDTLLGLLVVHHERPALYRVVHLRGVEAEGGHVALVEDAAAVHLHPEGMRGIVDDLKAVLVCYLLYPLVRGVMAASMQSGLMPQFDGSMSTNTGLMPFHQIEWVVATKLKGVVITSPVMRRAWRAVISGSVPLVKRLMKGTLRYSHRAASSSL